MKFLPPAKHIGRESYPRVQPTTTIQKGAAGHREWPCVTNAPALAKAYNLEEAELDDDIPRKFGGNWFWKKIGLKVFEEQRKVS